MLSLLASVLNNGVRCAMFVLFTSLRLAFSVALTLNLTVLQYLYATARHFVLMTSECIKAKNCYSKPLNVT